MAFSFLATLSEAIITQEKSLDPNTCIAFIGGGNMAKAMINGLLRQGHISRNILVCTPNSASRNELMAQFDVRVHHDNAAAVTFAQVIILAVKSFVIPTVCEQLNAAMAANKLQNLVISIAAGIKQASISKKLNDSTRVICAMPNLPTSIGAGLTGLYAAPTTAPRDIEQADTIMQAIGETVWIEDEQQMAAIVAAAGSSPAYLFLFLEAMEKAAIKQGLTQETASKAVLHSAMGAMLMAINSPHNLANLRHQVTSPKGTTEQAILAFQDGELDKLVASAMGSAATRAKELSFG